MKLKCLELERNSQTLVQDLGQQNSRDHSPDRPYFKREREQLPTIRVSLEAVACPRPADPSGAELTGKVKQTPTLTCTRRSSRDSGGAVHSSILLELQVRTSPLTVAVLQVTDKLPQDQSFIYTKAIRTHRESTVGRCVNVLLVFSEPRRKGLTMQGEAHLPRRSSEMAKVHVPCLPMAIEHPCNPGKKGKTGMSTLSPTIPTAHMVSPRQTSNSSLFALLRSS